MRNKLNLKAIILIIGALFSTQPLFGLVLVHNEFALAPKKPGSPATEVSVTANGARYRFIVGIKPGGHHPNPEGGFVYATDGYKYDQSKIKWEVQIRGSWTAITGDTTNEWGFFKIETAEAENRYLMSLHWQTPVKNETCHIRVKGERWPYRPGIGVGPYDPAWESAVDSLLEHPVINIVEGETALVELELKNTGDNNWDKTGLFPIHLATASARDHSSLFWGDDWLTNNRLQLQQEQVRPGEVGLFKFYLPENLALGSYLENYGSPIKY